jgi:glucose/arabinose dehydrogenase
MEYRITKIFTLGLLAALLLLALPAVIAQTDDDAEPVTTLDGLPDAAAFTLEVVADGLRNPLYVTHAGDGSGRIFILEQTGAVWIMRDGERLETPFIDLSNVVSQDVLTRYSERGLLGLAFHPDYADNGLFYVNYNDQQGTTHIERYSVSDDPDIADPDSGEVLFSIAQPYPNHNGGMMAFGPDGYLYISVGDGGGANDPVGAGQDPTDLLGTILRIDVDADDERGYGIPEDNPMFTVNPQLAPEIWSWGLRNVWRFSFDRATGDMYLADVGQSGWEEINFQPADSPGGENYGWPAYEGSQRHIGPEPATEVVMPVAEYNHSVGCSVTGGYVYRGEAIPELEGAYLYSDYCSGRVWAAYRDEAGEWHDGELVNLGIQVSSFGEDEDGELYLVDYRGRVLKFVPAS